VKKTLMTLAIAALATSAYADNHNNPEMLKIATNAGCMTCHQVEPRTDGKLPIGPAWKDVSKKYAGKKDAAATLTKEVMNGTNLYDSHWKGKVSGVAMPPNAVAIKEPDAKKLVAWILSLK
jgi:cytochrome c